MATSVIGALRTLQAQIHERNADVVPPGWRTVEQWAEAERMSIPHTGKILRSAVAKGLVEVRIFRVVTGWGVRNVQHYRIVQRKKQRSDG